MNTSELREQLAGEPNDAPLDVAGVVARARRIRRKRSGVVVASVVALVIAVSLVVRGPLAASSSQFPVAGVPSATPVSTSSPTSSRSPSATTAANASYTALNILLIGSDSRGTGQGTSDSIIVMHISADRRSVYLVSFPRDMWVTVPGYGKAKIDASYTYGGAALAVSTVETLTGARMDHVVVTNFADFVSLVDTVGPITVDNPVSSVATSDRGVTYRFTKGPLTITDGYMALAFVRERLELPNGDLDRTLRQRAFIKALALKIATPDVLANPVKLNAVIAAVGKYVAVDPGMTNDMILSLGLSLAGVSDPSQIHMVQAPITGFAMVDGQSTDVVDVAGNAALGEALQNDTMSAFLAAHPSTEQG
jgi:LCP family protein required for cell wall assembly